MMARGPRPHDTTSVLFVDCYPNSLYGAQLTLLDLATGLPEVTPRALLVGEGPLADRLRTSGVATTVLAYPPRLRRYDGELLDLRVPERVRVLYALLQHNLRVTRYLRRSKPDVVYCANLRAVLSVGAAARLLRVPLVWHVQSFMGRAGTLGRVAGVLSSRIVIISPQVDLALGPTFAGRFARKIRSIPIGIDAANWAKPTPQPDNPVARLVSVAATTRVKGLDVLVRAIRHVVDVTPVVLDLIGAPKSNDDERYEDELRALIRELDLEPVIRWAGHIDDVRSELASADLMVLASYREGVPRSIIEARLLGIPVVATDVGAVSDVVHDGIDGYLVQPGEPAQLAGAILRALEQRTHLRHVCERAVSDISDVYGLPRFLESFGRVVRDLRS